MEKKIEDNTSENQFGFGKKRATRVLYYAA
jgi:hypothetical protein